MGVVFVAGVHGVGKTTACAHAANSLGLAHYSASGLIKSEKASAISMGGKAVTDVEGNQSLLIQGVHKVCKQHSESIILDGHFTLLKPDGEIEAISIDVFRSLLLEGIVVYHDEPEAIAERLKDRDKVASDPVVVDQHQRIELKQAHLVATDLNIPIRVLKAFDEAGLVRLISE
jgi:adenylate kinase